MSRNDEIQSLTTTCTEYSKCVLYLKWWCAAICFGKQTDHKSPTPERFIPHSSPASSPLLHFSSLLKERRRFHEHAHKLKVMSVFLVVVRRLARPRFKVRLEYTIYSNSVWRNIHTYNRKLFTL